jgi:hypothetical protein
MSPGKLPHVLEYIQKCVDTSIPLGCAIPQALLVFHLAAIPPSIAAVLINPTMVYIWSVLSFIGYSCVVIGSWLKPSLRSRILKGKVAKHVYLYFLFPGLIASSISTSVYAGALIVANGLFSMSFVAICFILSMGVYFLFRFLRLYVSIKARTSEVSVLAGR